MMYAYDKNYLEKARHALGRMLDFAVYDLHYSLTDFFLLFLSGNLASRFETGDFTVTVGMSGVELAYEVIRQANLQTKRIQPRYTENRSDVYWVGWALAYYQWQTAMSFSAILHAVPITEIQRMYYPYHEMDIRQFADQMDLLILKNAPESNLKRIRKRNGLSQRELAELSNIPVRTIQQYEQKQKNINKAQTGYLLNLARILHCQVENLLDYPIKKA